MSRSDQVDPPTTPVRPTDIENKLREITSTVEGETAEARSLIPVVVTAVAVVVVVGVYLLGRKAGRKKAAFIEIRRI